MLQLPPVAHRSRYTLLQQALTRAYFLLGLAILGRHAHMVWHQRGRIRLVHPQSAARHHTDVGVVDQPG